MNHSIATEVQEMLIDLSERGIMAFKFETNSPLVVHESGLLHRVGEAWTPEELDTLAVALFGEAAIQDPCGPTGWLEKHWIVEKEDQSFAFIACAVKVLRDGVPGMDLTVIPKSHPSFERNLSMLGDALASRVVLH